MNAVNEEKPGSQKGSVSYDRIADVPMPEPKPEPASEEPEDDD